MGAGQLYRVVGVEGATLVGQLGLELGGEGEQGVVFDRRQPMLGGERAGYNANRTKTCWLSIVFTVVLV